MSAHREGGSLRAAVVNFSQADWVGDGIDYTVGDSGQRAWLAGERAEPYPSVERRVNLRAFMPRAHAEGALRY